MKLLVTGASGFLGQYVVAQALRQGYQVRAVFRPASNPQRFSWHNHPNLELARLDLRQKADIGEALQEIDAVIHLSATKSGDFYTQFAGTVLTTENLLSAMAKASVFRLIAISTFSVYDYLHLRDGALLNEETPIDKNPVYRDEYAQTKLIQEQLVRDFEQEHNAKVTIIRPGMVYGRDNLWNPCLGAEFGENIFLRIGTYGKMPLTYVENCAEAIVAAVDSDKAIAQTINIVDDDLPSKKTFTQELLKRASKPPTKIIPVNWLLMRFLANSAWLFNQVFLKGQARLPGILVPAKLEARFRSLCYTNQCAKELLNWKSHYSLNEALDRSCSNLDLLKI